MFNVVNTLKARRKIQSFKSIGNCRTRNDDDEEEDQEKIKNQTTKVNILETCWAADLRAAAAIGPNGLNTCNKVLKWQARA